MTITLLRDGVRHRIRSREDDPRVAWTECGLRVAFVAPCDPTSAYQRRVRHDCGPGKSCEACG